MSSINNKNKVGQRWLPRGTSDGATRELDKW